MKEFLTENFEWIIGFVAVAVFGYQAYRALKKAKKIETEGVLTDAVVSRIEETWDGDTNGTSYTTYVRYAEPDGTVRESPMALTSDMKYRVGDRIRIRCLPGDTSMVRPAE